MFAVLAQAEDASDPSDTVALLDQLSAALQSPDFLEYLSAMSAVTAPEEHDIRTTFSDLDDASSYINNELALPSVASQLPTCLTHARFTAWPVLKCYCVV